MGINGASRKRFPTVEICLAPQRGHSDTRYKIVMVARSPTLHDTAVALLNRAIESLRRDTDEESVHAARKSCKRARAALRLLRAGLGQREYRRDNLRIRNSARPLTAVRDAVVLRRTLGRLSKHAQFLQRDLEVDYHRAWQDLERRGVRSRGRCRLKAIREQLRKLRALTPEVASADFGSQACLQGRAQGPVQSQIPRRSGAARVAQAGQVPAESARSSRRPYSTSASGKLRRRAGARCRSSRGRS